jgi:hypothetical protein
MTITFISQYEHKAGSKNLKQSYKTLIFTTYFLLTFMTVNKMKE